MHGRDPQFSEKGEHLKEVWGVTFNDITFRMFLCIFIVFVPSILSHLPIMLGGSVLRGVISGLLGVVASVIGAFLLSHFY